MTSTSRLVEHQHFKPCVLDKCLYFKKYMFKLSFFKKIARKWVKCLFLKIPNELDGMMPVQFFSIFSCWTVKRSTFVTHETTREQMARPSYGKYDWLPISPLTQDLFS